MEKRVGRRLVGSKHRHHSIRVSVYAAAQLQPFQYRRHARSREAVLESELQGRVVLGNPSQWFNPAAFIAPPSTSGFFGNVGRDTYIGPGLGTWDFSVLKDTRIHERLNVQFRAEIFNILDRTNFNTPNLIVFTPPTATNLTGLSGTAGAISGTSTTARQVQFGLKLLW